MDDKWRQVSLPGDREGWWCSGINVLGAAEEAPNVVTNIALQQISYSGRCPAPVMGKVHKTLAMASHYSSASTGNKWSRWGQRPKWRDMSSVGIWSIKRGRAWGWSEALVEMSEKWHRPMIGLYGEGGNASSGGVRIPFQSIPFVIWLLILSTMHPLLGLGTLAGQDIFQKFFKWATFSYLLFFAPCSPLPGLFTHCLFLWLFFAQVSG